MSFQAEFERLCLLYSINAPIAALNLQARTCYAAATNEVEVSYLSAVLCYFEMETDWLEEAILA